MYRPQKLVAAFLGAALLCTTGIALADKGGNHGDKHSSTTQTAPAPGQNASSSASRGPGGMGKPQTAPGNFDRSMMRNRTDDGSGGSEFEGTVNGTGPANAKAAVNIKLSNGSSRTFAISSAAAESLKAHQSRGDLIFFTTNGQQVTAVCSRGEKDNMRVTARTGDTFMLQDQSGQTRLITLDSETANRLHVKVGSNVQVTALSATSGKIVALDLEKKHQFDKFALGEKSDVAKLDSDRRKADSDLRKLNADRAKGDTSQVAIDADVAKADADRAQCDRDQAKLD